MSTTTHPDWPTQIMLPGQSAAPEGPVDMTMMYVMHHAFRRDLTAFAEAARSTPADDRDTWAALAARWATFSRVLHHHHHGEDIGLWPLLMERTDAAGRVTLEAMEAEHGEIDPILEACAAGFTHLAGHSDEDARAALAVRLCAARESLGRHLAHEERDAIQIVQDVMTQAEMVQLEQDVFRTDTSLTQLLILIPWAAHGVPAEIREHIFAEGPSGQRLLWRLTRRGFEKKERRAFRYVA